MAILAIPTIEYNNFFTNERTEGYNVTVLRINIEGENITRLMILSNLVSILNKLLSDFTFVSPVF
jgi:hypothetical protein